MNQEQKNHDTQNIVPLGSDEIRSILKSQSESVFEDKNISNNSNFVKKSLIDIALDFESKLNVKENLDNEVTDDVPENNKNLHEADDVATDEQKTEETTPDEKNNSDNQNDMQAEKEKSNNELDIKSANESNLDEIEKDIQSEKLAQDVSHTDIESDTQKQQEKIKAESKADEIIKTDEETQQALDSVRDAVSQSMNKSEDENTITLQENKELSNNEDIKIEVKKALGQKCERCWKILEKKCERCSRVLQ